MAEENQNKVETSPSIKKDVPFAGRKVYFLNPTFTIRDNIITALWEQEYEVYVIDDLHYAKNILRHNPNSILYINVDVQLNIYAWYMYIDSFRYEDTLKTITMGIISDHLSQTMQDLFLTKSKIEAGIFSTKDTIPNLISAFKDILDMNGAKGLRQFVRVMCLGEQNSTILWQHGPYMHERPMIDLSVVGAAIKIKEKDLATIKECSVMPQVTVKLDGHTYVMDLFIRTIHRKENAIMAVSMFPKYIPYITKSRIKDYIFNTLNRQMLSSINGEMPDNDNYILLGDRFRGELEAEAEHNRRIAILEENQKERIETEEKLKNRR